MIKKELGQRPDTLEEVREYLFGQLSQFLLTYTESGGETDLELLRDRYIRAASESIRESFPELLEHVSVLYATAALNIAELGDASFRQMLIDQNIPTQDAYLVSKLVELQEAYGVGQQTTRSLISAINNPKKVNDTTLKSLGIFIRKICKEPTYAATELILDLMMFIWSELDAKARLECTMLFSQLRAAMAESDPINTAKLYMNWQAQIFAIGHEFDVKNTSSGVLHSVEKDKPSASTELLNLIPLSSFDAFGHALKFGAADQPTTLLTLFDQFDTVLVQLQDYPIEVIEGMLDVFVEAGYVRKMSGGKFRLTSSGKKLSHLGASELISVNMANRFLYEQKPFKDVRSLDDIWNQYAASDVTNAIPERTLKIDGTERRFLYLGDILFGQKDLDVETVQKMTVWLANLPDDEKPHQVIISGLVAGGFNFRKKEQRRALAVRSMNEQFKAAKLFIESIEALGLEVSYIMSSEDYEQCRNYTIMAMKSLQSWANPVEDTEKTHVTYWQEDQLKQIDSWDTHLDFQIKVAYPYNFRSGRRLRSADEIRAMRVVDERYRHLPLAQLENTPGAFVRQEEYILLFDAYQRLIKNEPLPAHYFDILEVENIPLPEKPPQGFGIYDGLKLTAKLDDGQEVTTLLHHNLSLTPTSLNADPFKHSSRLLGQMKAANIPIPDELVVFHQDVGAGMGSSTRLISTPGFSSPNLEQIGSAMEVKDRGARQMFSRDTLPTTGAIMSAIGTAGLSKTYFFTPELMDRAAISPDRVAIIPLIDTHIGSISARVDYLVHLLDIIQTQIVPDHPTALLFGGDHIESRNYPGMPNEHALLGLVQMRHQEEFLLKLLAMSLTQGRPLTDLPAYLQNIFRVGIVPGNHELNSQHKFTGYDFTYALENQMKWILEGSSGAEGIVRNFQSILTPGGDYFNHPSGFEPNIGGYGVWLSHQFAGKGVSGPAVFKSKSMMQGLGKMFSDTQIGISGHWHHEQYALVNGKLMLIAPSMVGPTGYETSLGVGSSPGANIIFVGQNQPVRLDSISRKMLATHVIKDGPFSEEALADANPRWVTDKDFDPLRHGLMGGPYSPHSALQKRLLDMAHEVVYSTPSLPR